MPRESLKTAVRMVGHLLEHHGCTGPFVANKDGRHLEPGDPEATQWCLAGACEEVAHRLFYTPHWLDRYVTFAVLQKLGQPGVNRIRLWEGELGRPTTPEQRLALARKLQE